MRSNKIIWVIAACVALSACTKKNSLYMEPGGTAGAGRPGNPASNAEQRPQAGAALAGARPAGPSVPAQRP
jgi:hypothetical protein